MELFREPAQGLTPRIYFELSLTLSLFRLLHELSILLGLQFTAVPTEKRLLFLAEKCQGLFRWGLRMFFDNLPYAFYNRDSVEDAR